MASFIASIFPIVISFPILIESVHIGLFASTGCYSHDIMMRHFANRLTSPEGGGHQVTLIQIRVFEFSLASKSDNFSKITPWQHLSFDAQGRESMETLGRFQTQMWKSLVPVDIDSPNLDGVQLLTQLHKHQTEACYKTLKDPVFMDKVKKLRLDLLVTDYVLNECAMRFTHILDVNLAYLSNYPVLSSYAADLGISSNPSYVPSVIGYETTNMDFPRRVVNSLLYFTLWSTRQWFDYDANQVFKRALGHRFFKKTRSKGLRSVLTFSTPFESVLDTPRPIARNLQYFGCDHCFDGGRKRGERLEELLNISNSGEGIILVTFGTVTAGDRIPVVQLQRLVRIFAKFPSFTFIWQLDLIDFADRVLAPINFPMPSNVHIFGWVPLKRLMADDNVVLTINHGGISTCSEAVHHGIPILGVALQGDQGYNLRRLIDKGVGEMLPISSLTEEIMCEKLSMMIGNIDRYRSAALKLRSKMLDHKSLYKGVTPSVFWISWTARHFGRGRNASEAATKAKRFLTLRYTSNWFLYYSLDVWSAFAAAVISVAWIAIALRNELISFVWTTKKGLPFA